MILAINTGRASISPDGTRILYLNYAESETLYVMNINGSNKKRLGNFDQAGNDIPQWIP